MKDYWLKFGCFLTGYNYTIVKQSSEAVAKVVKKNLSALLIIAIVWGFIGYVFTQRYLHGNLITSLAGALLMVIIIIQIERQIILTVGKNNKAMTFRIIIGIVMAIIGSVILDQIMFKEDVEKMRISTIQKEVNLILPMKTNEIQESIKQIDSALFKKEYERNAIIEEISQRPTIVAISSILNQRKDSITGKMVNTGKQITTQAIPNPKAELITQIDNHIRALRLQKEKKDSTLLNMRQITEAELKSKVGFLDELQILVQVLLSSNIALMVWVLIFMFFLMIELFILVNKLGDDKNDYDRLLKHQIDVRMSMIDKLNDNI